MHTRFLPLAAVCGLLLSACAPKQATLQDLSRNPLFAERYAEEMVNVLVELEIQQNPLVEDPAMKAQLETIRNEWLQKARDARDEQLQGTSAQMIPMDEYAIGEVLFLNKKMYLGPEFETVPGPDLHLYITTVVDPRDDTFPDPSAIDLGRLVSPYGAQHYAVPDVSNPLAYRTVVLWDPLLQRLYGFAQLAQ